MMEIRPQDKTIGFIGTGVMGCSMAANLMKAGCSLRVHNRTPAKCEPLLDKGAAWEGAVSGIAGKCDLVITIVGFPRDVDEVYLGEGGLIQNAEPGTYLIDMTTSKPDLAEEIHRRAGDRGCRALDAPVSGGDKGAREAILSIMVGGDREDFDALMPLFRILGKNIVHQGKAGSGQHTKMCNQIAIAAGMLGVCEAIRYAQKSGLDPQTVLESIESGAAGSWSLSNLGPRMIAGDFDPGFYVKHFIKDMTIASESAKEMGLETPGLDLAKVLYEELAQKGFEQDGTQALFRLY